MNEGAPSNVQERAERRVGTSLRQKYRLDALLGVGGMAAVYMATHLRNGNRVAVKILHAEMSIDADIRHRFLKEGYVANKVNHPGAVRVLDDETAEDGSVFLVMELLEGETVDGRWEKQGRKVPVEEVCRIAHQLLDVLAAAHSQNIVHRDIKPENLFLTRDGVVKVLDFGIARLRESANDAGTRTGRAMGTPAFMPPEQARGRKAEVDGQTDLWAVGATMFVLLSGQYVHDAAETVEELLIFTATRPARSLATAAPEVPGPILAVIDKALAFAKVDRWPTARAMEEALEGAYQAAFGRALPVARASAPSFEPATFDATLRAAGSAVTPLALDDTAATPATPAHAAPAVTGQPLQVATAKPLSTTAGLTSGPSDAPAQPQPRRASAVIALFVGILALGGVALGVSKLAGSAPATTSGEQLPASTAAESGEPLPPASTETAAAIIESEQPPAAPADAPSEPSATASAVTQVTPSPPASSSRRPSAPAPRPVAAATRVTPATVAPTRAAPVVPPSASAPTMPTKNKLCRPIQITKIINGTQITLYEDKCD